MSKFTIRDRIYITLITWAIMIVFFIIFSFFSETVRHSVDFLIIACLGTIFYQIFDAILNKK